MNTKQHQLTNSIAIVDTHDCTLHTFVFWFICLLSANGLLSLIGTLFIFTVVLAITGTLSLNLKFKNLRKEI